jgi:Winged helix DNA-binding domain
MPPRITSAQVNAFRLTRHHLAGTQRSNLLDVASDVCGIQAQIMASAQLSLNARLPNLTRDEIRSALNEKRTLIKTHCMRQTLHLLPSAQYATYISANKKTRAKQVRNVMDRFKITDREADQLLCALMDALAEKPLAQKALRAAVRPQVSKKVRAWMDKVWGIVRPAVVEGLVCYGPDDGNEITYVRTEDWLPKQKSIDPESAQQFLLRAYLRAYGPATARDFAFWSGISMKEVAAAWKSVEDEFAEVELEDRKAFILREDLRELRTSSLEKPDLRLLANFDVFLLAHAEKSHMVHDRHYKLIYRNQGWISPVILLDGKVIGTWSQKVTGKKLAIALKPFDRLPKSLHPQIEAEAERIAKFVGAGVHLPPGVDVGFGLDVAPEKSKAKSQR